MRMVSTSSSPSLPDSFHQANSSGLSFSGAGKAPSEVKGRDCTFLVAMSPARTFVGRDSSVGASQPSGRLGVGDKEGVSDASVTGEAVGTLATLGDGVATTVGIDELVDSGVGAHAEIENVSTVTSANTHFTRDM